MKVLVIGGTRFLGPAVVSEALARGHEVTTFTRGVSGEPPEGVTALHGDREHDADLEQLRGRDFDLVVDTCGFTPSVVGRSAAVLAGTAAHYAFISTINVYPDWPEQPIEAGSRVWDCPPDASEAPPELTDAGPYGYLKAGSERAVEQHFPGRCTQVRAGLLVGPHDNSGRLTYWIRRIAEGGRVAVPGPADQHLSVIDVRDLAAWILARHPGAFNATGPSDMTTYGEVFGATVAATGSAAELVWIPESIIETQEVQPWVELPLWLPATEKNAFAVDVRPILEAGLHIRPIAETIADTWAWQRTAAATTTNPRAATGLPPDKEAALLAAVDKATDPA
jgi:nucleoside-diphosphate-sugar epimerase